MSLDRDREIAEAARDQLYARRGRAERIASLIADGWSQGAAHFARREHDAGPTEPDGPAARDPRFNLAEYNPHDYCGKCECLACRRRRWRYLPGVVEACDPDPIDLGLDPADLHDRKSGRKRRKPRSVRPAVDLTLPERPGRSR